MNRPVALITGASRGIGRALVAELADDFHLLIGGRSDSAVAEVVAGVPSASGFVVDLADEAAVERAAAEIPRLDVLIHCAGVLPRAEGPVRARWREVFEINVVAVVHLTELLLPVLRAASGQVVMINSGSGLNAFADVSGYAASKFALTAYADGLRESERVAIRVSSVHPGRVDTDMQRDLQARAGRPYRADEHMTARAVARAVRAVIDAPSDANVDSLEIRPSGNKAR